MQNMIFKAHKNKVKNCRLRSFLALIKKSKICLNHNNFVSITLLSKYQPTTALTRELVHCLQGHTDCREGSIKGHLP